MTEETIDSLRDVLIRHGFVRCSIPACACGSWHPRYGLTERFEEIKEALAEAGHPLTNDNGNKALNALRELIKERDDLAARLSAVLETLGGRDAEINEVTELLAGVPDGSTIDRISLENRLQVLIEERDRLAALEERG